MKTDDLILALAADTIPQPGVRVHLSRALPTALALSVAAFALLWGTRADLGTALASFAALKTLVPLAVLALALTSAIALAHPGTGAVWRNRALAGVIALVALSVPITVARDGLDALGAALSTPQLLTCLLSVPALALPLLAAVFWALSAGAALRPGWTGAMAGLAAGAGAAALYSLYCDKDMVLFVVPAYATAILLVTALGAALGPRLLKW